MNRWRACRRQPQRPCKPSPWVRRKSPTSPWRLSAFSVRNQSSKRGPCFISPVAAMVAAVAVAADAAAVAAVAAAVAVAAVVVVAVAVDAAAADAAADGAVAACPGAAASLGAKARASFGCIEELPGPGQTVLIRPVVFAPTLPKELGKHKPWRELSGLGFRRITEITIAKFWQLGHSLSRAPERGSFPNDS